MEKKMIFHEFFRKNASLKQGSSRMIATFCKTKVHGNFEFVKIILRNAINLAVRVRHSKQIELIRELKWCKIIKDVFEKVRKCINPLTGNNHQSKRSGAWIVCPRFTAQNRDRKREKPAFHRSHASCPKGKNTPPSAFTFMALMSWSTPGENSTSISPSNLKPRLIALVKKIPLTPLDTFPPYLALWKNSSHGDNNRRRLICDAGEYPPEIWPSM